MQTLSEIRKTFLDYFARQGHKVLPSSALVPANDPTLMFTNAGMVQFKNVFTGAEERAVPRAATSQKCVRAGGKHNDLDNVGYTARHHTFFEMLGNFSFGDYFKDDAVRFAWELITKDYGLDPKRLCVTVYADDDEAAKIWKKVAGFSDDRIIRIATSDNFWSMGDTGPCGPCSEIFFDHGDKIWGGPPGSAEQDGDRFVEIWNLVFMQFDQRGPNDRVSLPKPSIDTGMGLERLAAVLQGVHSNYETDLFRTLINASEDLFKVKAEGDQAASHRVIADHLRASSFLMADGVAPSADGRGYVLRRIMRRAMRHAHILGAREPSLYKLFPTLLNLMGDAYPELKRAEPVIVAGLRDEEERFQRTLGRGLQILDEETGKLKKGAALSGETAFQLYDTYGFPLDLTQDILRGRELQVDVAGFDAMMEKQKAASRANWGGSGDAAVEGVWLGLKDRVKPTEFVGYQSETGKGKVLAILRKGAEVDALSAGDEAELVLDATPFYGESGGQSGDMGVISVKGGRFVVRDTQKRAGGLFAHKGVLEQGKLAKGAVVELEIARDRRARIRSNHSATHLLHAALRNVLGPHVSQKGSMVDADKLRFDFSHNAALTAAEITAIEAEVNAVIRQNVDSKIIVTTPEKAIEAGALALFGEKYGDEVRVLTLGQSLSDPSKPYSVELCGGTHVARTGDIAVFVISSEGGVQSGVRRIEALTGEAALQYFRDQAQPGRIAADSLKSPLAELPDRVAALVETRKKLERELTEARKALALGGGGKADTGPETVAGVKFLGRVLDGVAAKDLRGMVDEAKKQLGEGIVAYIGIDGGRAALTIGVTAGLSGKVSAVDLVRVGAAALGGQGGGGRPDMAQAGGPDADKAEDALAAIRAELQRGA